MFPSFVWVFVFVVKNCVSAFMDFLPDPSLQVTTSNGIVQGKQYFTEENGIPYYGYKGIPYARPPINNLRFKAPLPPRNWSGVLNARHHGNKCIQIYPEPSSSEDCLFINIYTPVNRATQTDIKLLPVMFWIFGGLFMLGNGNDLVYGPDYLIEHDVVVVTMNYRIGIFGFLSTGDMASPGNYGLKDQLAALRWTHRNIANFGGDPRQITIFGQSAGGASVQYLLQTPKAKGLFRRAISQSGSTLCPWALQKNPKMVAAAVGTLTGFVGDDSKKLVNHLRSVDATILNIAASTVFFEMAGKDAFHGFAFAPVTEPPHEGAIITNKSHELLRKGNFSHVSYMAGYNSEESIFLQDIIDVGFPNTEEYETHQEIYVPQDLNIPPNSTEAKEVLKKIRNVYFDSSDLPTDNKLLNLASDDQFTRPIQESIKQHSKRAPTYFYVFSYEGYYIGKRSLVIPRGRKFKGVGHTEEVWYLWSRIDLRYGNATDMLLRKKLTKLWTNFAKTGNPTPNVDTLLDNVTWFPVKFTEKHGTLDYLDIDATLSMKKNFKARSMNMWNNVYKKYGRPPYDTY